MNKQGIIKSISVLFPTRWYSTTRFGVNQILLSVIMASFCGINRINKISSFTGDDGLTGVLLKPDRAISENAISTTLKRLRQKGARSLQFLLLSINVCWLKESGLTRITPDADSAVKLVCGNRQGEAKGFNTIKKGAKSYYPLLVFVNEIKLLYHSRFRTGSAYTANDILWQLSVFAYNLSVMMRQKKNKFRRQEHRRFIDWFIAVPAKITGSGHQVELKLYEHYFYKADWE